MLSAKIGCWKDSPPRTEHVWLCSAGIPAPPSESTHWTWQRAPGKPPAKGVSRLETQKTSKGLAAVPANWQAVV
eukprot:5545857-Amphidinium_carterae.1